MFPPSEGVLFVPSFGIEGGLKFGKFFFGPFLSMFCFGIYGFMFGRFIVNFGN